MQHIASVLSTREASRYVDVDATTIQRAIARGDLNASRPRDRAPYRIQRADLFKWAADNGYSGLNAEGERIDLSTGELLADGAEPALPEAPADRGAAVADARARLAGYAPVKGTAVLSRERDGGTDYLIPEAPAAPEAPNVSRILLPSADAGLLEAAKRLVALPESPELWQALRAVLGVAG